MPADVLELVFKTAGKAAVGTTEGTSVEFLQRAPLNVNEQAAVGLVPLSNVLLPNRVFV